MIDKKKQYQNKYKITNKLGINYNSTGFLSVKVVDRLSNEPISFAEVSIYLLNISGIYKEKGVANIVFRDTTDGEGKVPLIELPVINRADITNKVINSPNPQYFMTVKHFRYNPVDIMNIQIYPNITIEYKVLLSRITSNQPGRYEYLITPEKH